MPIPTNFTAQSTSLTTFYNKERQPFHPDTCSPCREALQSLTVHKIQKIVLTHWFREAFENQIFKPGETQAEMDVMLEGDRVTVTQGKKAFVAMAAGNPEIGRLLNGTITRVNEIYSNCTLEHRKPEQRASRERDFYSYHSSRVSHLEPAGSPGKFERKNVYVRDRAREVRNSSEESSEQRCYRPRRQRLVPQPSAGLDGSLPGRSKADRGGSASSSDLESCSDELQEQERGLGNPVNTGIKIAALEAQIAELKTRLEGLEASTAQDAAVRKGRNLQWVNDQITAVKRGIGVADSQLEDCLSFSGSRAHSSSSSVVSFSTNNDEELSSATNPDEAIKVSYEVLDQTIDRQLAELIQLNERTTRITEALNEIASSPDAETLEVINKEIESIRSSTEQMLRDQQQHLAALLAALPAQEHNAITAQGLQQKAKEFQNSAEEFLKELKFKKEHAQHLLGILQAKQQERIAADAATIEALREQLGRVRQEKNLLAANLAQEDARQKLLLEESAAATELLAQHATELRSSLRERLNAAENLGREQEQRIAEQENLAAIQTNKFASLSEELRVKNLADFDADEQLNRLLIEWDNHYERLDLVSKPSQSFLEFSRRQLEAQSVSHEATIQRATQESQRLEGELAETQEKLRMLQQARTEARRAEELFEHLNRDEQLYRAIVQQDSLNERLALVSEQSKIPLNLLEFRRKQLEAQIGAHKATIQEAAQERQQLKSELAEAQKNHGALTRSLEERIAQAQRDTLNALEELQREGVEKASTDGLLALAYEDSKKRLESLKTQLEEQSVSHEATIQRTAQERGQLESTFAKAQEELQGLQARAKQSEHDQERIAEQERIAAIAQANRPMRGTQTNEIAYLSDHFNQLNKAAQLDRERIEQENFNERLALVSEQSQRSLDLLESRRGQLEAQIVLHEATIQGTAQERGQLESELVRAKEKHESLILSSREELGRAQEELRNLQARTDARNEKAEAITEKMRELMFKQTAAIEEQQRAFHNLQERHSAVMIQLEEAKRSLNATRSEGASNAAAAAAAAPSRNDDKAPTNSNSNSSSTSATTSDTGLSSTAVIENRKRDQEALGKALGQLHTKAVKSKLDPSQKYAYVPGILTLLGHFIQNVHPDNKLPGLGRISESGPAKRILETLQKSLTKSSASPTRRGLSSQNSTDEIQWPVSLENIYTQMGLFGDATTQDSNAKHVNELNKKLSSLKETERDNDQFPEALQAFLNSLQMQDIYPSLLIYAEERDLLQLINTEITVVTDRKILARNKVIAELNTRQNLSNLSDKELIAKHKEKEKKPQSESNAISNLEKVSNYLEKLHKIKEQLNGITRSSYGVIKLLHEVLTAFTTQSSSRTGAAAAAAAEPDASPAKTVTPRYRIMGRIMGPLTPRSQTAAAAAAARTPGSSLLEPFGGDSPLPSSVEAGGTLGPPSLELLGTRPKDQPSSSSSVVRRSGRP